MEKNMDPNIPDTSNGVYFCRLCLIEVNSEQMWAIHVAGKRHYRNLMKYPDGIALRENGGLVNHPFEKPSKYRRYENDEWNGCSSEENEYYAHINYVPEIKPQVIDYGHTKGLSDVISPPVSKTLHDVPVKEKHENPIHEIFEDEKYEELNKYFKEKIAKVQSDGMERNTWDSNKVKPQNTWNSNKEKPQNTRNSNNEKPQNTRNSNKEKPQNTRDSNKEKPQNTRDSNKEKPQNTRNSNKVKPQNTWNTNKVKPHVEESSNEDEFEKELDELLKDSSDNPEPDEEAFSNHNFKRKIEDLFSGYSSKREGKDKELKIPRIDNIKDTLKVSNKTKIQDDSTSVKKRDDKDKMKNDRDSFKTKKSRKTTDEDFVDIFHKMNDEKLFEMSAADEEEDIYAMKKSSKTENPKLDDIDPDKLTTDLVDNLLSSYMKTKADSSKSKESSESCTKSLETNTKEDDLETFSRKLESLPTKTFFQIILGRLKTLDLKDSDELQMVLEVISQAQEVVCKKLPPHLQAVIKAKMSQSNSTKTTPVSVQYPVLPKTESVGTTFPAVSKIVSKPDAPTISTPTSKLVTKSITQEAAKSVSQSVSNLSSQSVQIPISNTASSPKLPRVLTNLDSFQSMIAWQNYLSTKGTASEKQALKSANAVQATLAYQNYLSKLQANAVSTKTTSENTASLNPCSNSKASLSSSSNSTQSTAQTVSESVRKLLSTPKSVHTKDTLRNLFSSLKAGVSKTVSQTSSSSLTKSASALDSSQNQSTSKNCTYVSQRDKQTVSSTAEIPSKTRSCQNQPTAAQYQAYQQYAMHLQRMSGQYANIGSSPSASLAALRQNLAVSQPKSSLPPNSHSKRTK